MSENLPLDLEVGAAIVQCPKCARQLVVADPGAGVLVHEEDGFHIYQPKSEVAS